MTYKTEQLTIKTVPETDEIETMITVDGVNHYEVYPRSKKAAFIAYVEDPARGGKAGDGNTAIQAMGW